MASMAQMLQSRGGGGPTLTGQDATNAAIARSGMSPGAFQQWLLAQGGAPVPGLPQGGPAPGFAKGGAVAVEDTEGDGPTVKTKRQRQWGDVGKHAEDLPPEKKAKGGAIKRRRPVPAKGKEDKGDKTDKKKLPVPMVTDDDMNPPPPAAAAAAAPAIAPAVAPPVAPPPPAGPPPVMKEGGKVEEKNQGGACKDKMAAGGVAKVRHGFPKTLAKPKKFAQGGTVRGCGAATKGKNFSGIY
jgi:hypothetical protein